MSASRKRWIIGLAVLIGAVLIMTWTVRGRGGGQDQASQGGPPSGGGRRGGGAGGADRVIPVVVTPAAKRDVPSYLDGLGSVVAYKTVNVRTQVEGRLDRVAFAEGQTVRKGDLLAQVDPRPFEIQLHQAEAALARDQAQLRGAQRNLERFASVAADRLLPQQQVDDQRALTEQLEGTVRTDKAQIENAQLQLAYAHIVSPIDGVTGIRLVDPGNVVHVADTSGIVVVTQLDPIAVLFTLPQDDLPRVARAQAQQAGAAGEPVGAGGAGGGARAGGARSVAPRVGAARSGGGDAAADVARADNGLTVEALGRAGDQMIATGRLALIDNQINQSTATIRLKAIFANPDRTLWPNQFVKARLRLGVRRGVLVVPAASIQRGPQGTFVYVVGDDSKAAVRPVEVDAIEGDAAILKESAHGVAPGDRVVSEGQNQLRPGARVDAREPGGVAGARAPDGGGGPGGGAHGRGGNGGSGPRGHGQGNGRPPQEKPAP